jgi:ribosomal protein RSM22 (predicted rRNA methylase)
MAQNSKGLPILASCPQSKKCPILFEKINKFAKNTARVEKSDFLTRPFISSKKGPKKKEKGKKADKKQGNAQPPLESPTHSTE